MNRHERARLWDAVVSCFAIFLGLIIVFPVIYCILGAFKTPAEFASPALLPRSFAYWENFRNALHQAPLLRYMLNSFLTAFAGSFIRLALAVCAAFALTQYDFRGKKLCFFFLLGTMMMPADTLLMANYATVSRLGLLNSYLGIIIVSFVSASQMFLLRQKFLSFPKSLRHAAMVDGCSDLRYLLTIVLPLCRGTLTTLFVQSFLSLCNAYLWPLMVTASAPDMRTIMVGITKLNSWEDTNYELVLAGVTISLIPSFLLFALMRRNLNKDNTEGSLNG